MMNSKKKLISGALVALLFVAGCQGPITDPEEEDNHDDESSDEPNDALNDDLPNGGGGATDVPVDSAALCIWPTPVGGYQTPVQRVCLRQTAPDVDDYVAASCGTNYVGYDWVRAIGESNPDPLEVWVAIQKTDQNFTTKQIHGSGATETTYSPSLIHKNGDITGHRECNKNVTILDRDCPSDANGCTVPSQD